MTLPESEEREGEWSNDEAPAARATGASFLDSNLPERRAVRQDAVAYFKTENCPRTEPLAESTR